MQQSNLGHQKKERSVAILLSFFFGFWGIHRFYLNQVGLGILYIVLSFTGISFLIGFIDFLAFIFMSQNTFDRKYNPHLFQRNDMNNNYQYNNHAPQANRPAQQQQQQQQRHPAQQNRQSQVPAQQMSRDTERNVRMLRTAQQLRDEIYRTIGSEKHKDNYIVQDLKPLINKYVEQIQELVERDQKLEKLLSGSTTEKVDHAIAELSRRLTTTTNPELKREYEKAIARHMKHKQSLTELHEQREMIHLRLDSTIMSLKEIKFDLIRMESLETEDQRQSIYQQFEAKTDELSNYLKLLRNDYDDLEIDQQLQ